MVIATAQFCIALIDQPRLPAAFAKQHFCNFCCQFKSLFFYVGSKKNTGDAPFNEPKMWNNNEKGWFVSYPGNSCLWATVILQLTHPLFCHLRVVTAVRIFGPFRSVWWPFALFS